jgi:peptide deformylase
MKIVTAPNEVLLKKASGVKKFDNKLRSIIREMEKVLLATRDPKGVGLAAPQVGMPLRIFLMKISDKDKMQVFINPVIKKVAEETQAPKKETTQKKSKKESRLLEGCLSVPNIWSNIKRDKVVILQYQDETGKPHTKIFKNFPAVVVQHEVDHLDGILFTKRAIEQKQKLFRSYKNEKGEDEFEEIKLA